MARAKKQVAAAQKRASTDTPGESITITITFTGDPRGGRDPEIAEYGGRQFSKGKPVVIDDAAWLAANVNIRRNNHFTVR